MDYIGYKQQTVKFAKLPWFNNKNLSSRINHMYKAEEYIK